MMYFQPMAFDEFLEERIQQQLDQKNVSYQIKHMMGGSCFMVDNKMCVGIVRDELMARIDPEIYQEALTKPGASEMNFTGRPMKGYVFVAAESVDAAEDLEYWVQLCLDFNPKAKASKKKKK